jgi:hypothetical protein
MLSETQDLESHDALMKVALWCVALWVLAALGSGCLFVLFVVCFVFLFDT